MNKRHMLVWLVAACALSVRLGLVVWAGNTPETSLTGGSDTFAYQALADSIANHRGFSYAGMPTALRPPLYPMVLVLGRFIADGQYRIFIRLVQLLIGMSTAIVCAKTSRKLDGSPAIAFATALAAPTLVFFTAEILSETLAALIIAAFFYVVITESSPIWAGAVIGLGMLERFNLATLAVTYLVYQFATKKPSEAARHVALAGLVAICLVSPWFVRNLLVFHGQVLYSTHTGTNLLQGLISPDGRTQSGDTDKLEAAAGWTISDIETNSPSRTTFPAEPQLDHMATNAAVAELSHVNLFALAARKLGYFWLSFDQLFRTQALSRFKRFVRVLGILVYWFLLVVAVAGWCKLKSRNPDAALLFAAYAVVVTAMHLPFVMNTRIRSPLVEPALAILAGLALAAFAGPSGISPKGENGGGPESD
ncbi:MAG: glycosyltransferase family 39 protein [Candidatus Acidiferrales bacterium]